MTTRRGDTTRRRVARHPLHAVDRVETRVESRDLLDPHPVGDHEEQAIAEAEIPVRLGQGLAP